MATLRFLAAAILLLVEAVRRVVTMSAVTEVAVIWVNALLLGSQCWSIFPGSSGSTIVLVSTSLRGAGGQPPASA